MMVRHKATFVGQVVDGRVYVDARDLAGHLRRFSDETQRAEGDPAVAAAYVAVAELLEDFVASQRATDA